MVILTIFAKLRKAKVELSPAMGIIVMFLHNNGYVKKEEKSIPETVLKENVLTEIEQNLEEINPEKEFEAAIKSLEQLKVIRVQDGNVTLIEEVKI